MDFRSRAANELDRDLSIETNDMLVQAVANSEPDIFSK